MLERATTVTPGSNGELHYYNTTTAINRLCVLYCQPRQKPITLINHGGQNWPHITAAVCVTDCAASLRRSIVSGLCPACA